MGRMPEVIIHAATKYSDTSPGRKTKNKKYVKPYGSKTRVKPYEPKTYVKPYEPQEPTRIKRKTKPYEPKPFSQDTTALEMQKRARQQNDYTNTTAHAKAAQKRSYASYERAVNKSDTGSQATKAARNKRRLSAELEYNKNRSDAQKFADDVRQNVKLSKNVPSQNPTAGGGSSVTTGKERPGHKYVKKVRTKSGKIRYVYDDSVTTASGKHANANSAFDSQRHGKHVSNKNAYMNAWKRREQSENAQRARNADPVRQVQNFAKRTMRSISSAGSGAIDAARGFLKQFGIG